MPYTNEAKNRMLDHLAGEITQIRILDGASATIATEPVTFTAAGAEVQGQVDHGSVTFAVPAGTTVSSVEYLDAVDTVLATADVVDETFAQDGQYQITDASYLDLNG